MEFHPDDLFSFYSSMYNSRPPGGGGSGVHSCKFTVLVLNTDPVFAMNNFADYSTLAMTSH